MRISLENQHLTCQNGDSWINKYHSKHTATPQLNGLWALTVTRVLKTIAYFFLEGLIFAYQQVYHLFVFLFYIKWFGENLYVWYMPMSKEECWKNTSILDLLPQNYSLFNSPDLKAQVSFSDRPSVCKLSTSPEPHCQFQQNWTQSTFGWWVFKFDQMKARPIIGEIITK